MMILLLLLYSFHYSITTVASVGPPFYVVESESKFTQELVGLYCKTEDTTRYGKDWSSYRKQTGNIFLYLPAGYWRFSEKMGDLGAQAKANFNYKYAHEITWNGMEVKGYWAIKDYETKCAESLVSDNTEECPVHTYLIIGSVLCLAVCIACCLVGIAIGRRMRKDPEERNQEATEEIPIPRIENIEYDNDPYYSVV
eukprot:GFUD01026501.1.p1 GENE.GFUD01026501.1~~GFUD01026501.1.p1  ORF type:complete len:206 (-),score=28.96 GFUD01026501.1:136-726(-)